MSFFVDRVFALDGPHQVQEGDYDQILSTRIRFPRELWCRNNTRHSRLSRLSPVARH